MIPMPQGGRMERAVAAETLAAALSPLSVRAIQQRLERILLDSRGEGPGREPDWQTGPTGQHRRVTPD